MSFRSLAWALLLLSALDAFLSVWCRPRPVVVRRTSPAWMIDAVLGDQSPDRAGIGSFAAIAGYPHLTVPMGAVTSKDDRTSYWEGVSVVIFYSKPH